MILDCESFESTIFSLSEIFRISSEQLKNILLDANYEKLCGNNGFKPIEDIIFDDISQRCNQFTFHKEVYFFHVTRTMCIENFENGIHPLGLILDKLFESLYILVKDCISEEDWNNIELCSAGGCNANLYTMKTSNKSYYGPFALLIKEVAFCDDLGNHNFLKIPEIIEDIGLGINQSYGIDFCKRFLDNSVPAIIKFKMDVEPNCYKLYLKSALLYLYYKTHNRKLRHRLISISYDGKNTIIPYSDICKIEIVKQT